MWFQRGEENQDVVSLLRKTTCIYVEDVMEICLVLISYHTGPRLYMYILYIYIYIHMNHHFPVLYAIAAGTPPKKHHDKKSNIYSKM